MEIEEVIEMRIMMEVEVSLEKDNTETIIEDMTEVAVVDLRSGSRVSTNRDRIRCYKCREYDQFAKKTVQHQNQKRKQNKYNKCLIWIKSRHH